MGLMRMPHVILIAMLRREGREVAVGRAGREGLTARTALTGLSALTARGADYQEELDFECEIDD
jgi:hypothetical protein